MKQEESLQIITVVKSKCKYHGTKYQSFKSSGLCCHPSCIKGLVVYHSKTSKTIHHMLITLESYAAEEDLINYIVERLMSEEIKGKPAVINQRWLYYSMSNFIKKRMIKPIAEEMFDTIAEDELMIVTKNNPEKIVLTKEILEIASTIEDSELLLYLTGELTQTDAMKLFSCSAKQLKERVAQFRGELKKKI